MDAVASSIYDLSAAMNAPGNQPGAPGGTVSTFDIAGFQNAFDASRAGATSTQPGATTAPGAVEAPSKSAFESLVGPLVKLNDRAGAVRAESFEKLAAKENLTPSDMLTLTMEVHKFSFHSHLTSNIADKSSRGIQQLFRQKG